MYIFNLYKFSKNVTIFVHSKYTFFKEYTIFKERKKVCVFNVHLFQECTQFYTYNIQNSINVQNSIHLMHTILYIQHAQFFNETIECTQFIEECKQFCKFNLTAHSKRDLMSLNSTIYHLQGRQICILHWFYFLLLFLWNLHKVLNPRRDSAHAAVETWAVLKFAVLYHAFINAIRFASNHHHRIDAGH